MLLAWASHKIKWAFLQADWLLCHWDWTEHQAHKGLSEHCWAQQTQHNSLTIPCSACTRSPDLFISVFLAPGANEWHYQVPCVLRTAKYLRARKSQVWLYRRQGTCKTRQRKVKGRLAEYEGESQSVFSRWKWSVFGVWRPVWVFTCCESATNLMALNHIHL